MSPGERLAWLSRPNVEELCVRLHSRPQFQRLTSPTKISSRVCDSRHDRSALLFGFAGQAVMDRVMCGEHPMWDHEGVRHKMLPVLLSWDLQHARDPAAQFRHALRTRYAVHA